MLSEDSTRRDGVWRGSGGGGDTYIQFPVVLVMVSGLALAGIYIEISGAARGEGKGRGGGTKEGEPSHPPPHHHATMHNHTACRTRTCAWWPGPVSQPANPATILYKLTPEICANRIHT